LLLMYCALNVSEFLLLNFIGASLLINSAAAAAASTTAEAAAIASSAFS
jgi:hypothetical protein